VSRKGLAVDFIKCDYSNGVPLHLLVGTRRSYVGSFAGSFCDGSNLDDFRSQQTTFGREVLFSAVKKEGNDETLRFKSLLNTNVVVCEMQEPCRCMAPAPAEATNWRPASLWRHFQLHTRRASGGATEVARRKWSDSAAPLFDHSSQLDDVMTR